MFHRSRRLIGVVGLDCHNNVKSEKLPKLRATLSTSPVSRDAKSANITTYWTLLGFLGASLVLFYWSRKNLWPSINLEARYKEFPPLKFGKSNELRPGEWVITLGSSLSLKNTITSRIVSTVSCTMQNWGPDIQYVQIDPFPEEYSAQRKKPKRYRIGVSMISISPSILYSIRHEVHDIPKDLQNGVFLDKVYPGSPASDAGLQVNDIIVKINGTPITSSNQVIDMVQKGKPLNIEVVRGPQLLKITVTPEVLI